MRLFFAVFFLVSLAGCATSYQPRGFSGGYSETRLAEEVFEVSFVGNGYTSAERAADFAMLRSAQVALTHGFRYFIIIGAERPSDVTGTYTAPSTSHTAGSARASGGGRIVTGQANTFNQGGNTDNISKPSATKTILCFKENPDTGSARLDTIVYDAEFVSKSIMDKYNIAK